ncbi:S8 family peptidase [[Kitasatospora] papulosa]|jgi:subtilisin family serine protease|uniref:Peptidase S8 and S53 subtilisin kexin sedolisin n=2 Tax=Streptomyces TaxID=1883 RepID=A0A8D4BAA0_STRFA|nr:MULTISPECIES: S8 family peptidase [Streptomyces]RAS29308.1 subtilisin family serine protease [Streptomyces avidinii]SNX78297.1 Serine protease, subtilisin family [Streptomyces microflavus]MCX4417919.1 S8 family peptidase [[Kitasatospora] papulosa]MCY1654459.1 S8 family peptidase [Streptomyces sp. SL203]MCY1678250.1 S8 family peptidase [Streptomyces sp. SL294]
MALHKRARSVKLTASITAVAAAAGVTLLATPFAGAAPAPATGTVYGADAATAVSGSYIVMLDQKADKAGLAKEYGGTLQRTYKSAINGFSASGLSETEAKRLAADPAVSKVVQNKKFHIDATQDNPPSWGLDRIDQAETAGDGAYTYPDAAGGDVTAYVIDTGVRVTHKDFEGRATSGFDAVDNDEDADDGNGHGTHVAGTIAGAAHGVAKKAKIVAVRVLDDAGSGTTEQVVAGIDWVTANHEGPSVANMSLGGGADPALDAAVEKAIASGVTFAVAAGNESSDAGEGSPSRVPEAITVASSTEDDEQSSFSNFGSVVDIYAPGSDITSAWNDSDDATNTISGTSMATPHVVGAAAVYLGGHPDATPEEVAKALTDGATPDAISNATEGTANKLLKVVE